MLRKVPGWRQTPYQWASGILTPLLVREASSLSAFDLLGARYQVLLPLLPDVSFGGSGHPLTCDSSVQNSIRQQPYPVGCSFNNEFPSALAAVPDIYEAMQFPVYTGDGYHSSNNNMVQMIPDRQLR